MYSNLDEAWGAGSNSMFASTIPPSSLSIEPSYNYAPPIIQQPSYQPSTPIGENSIHNGNGVDAVNAANGANAVNGATTTGATAARAINVANATNDDIDITNSIDRLKTNDVNNVHHTPFCTHSPPIDSFRVGNDVRHDAGRDAGRDARRNDRHDTKKDIDDKKNKKRNNDTHRVNQNQSGGSNLYVPKESNALNEPTEPTQQTSYQDTCEEILERILDLNCSECHAKINKMLNTNGPSLLSRSSNDDYFSQGISPYANVNYDRYFSPGNRRYANLGRQKSMMYLAPSNDAHGPSPTPSPSHPGNHLQSGGSDGTRLETPCVVISHEALEIIKGLVIGFLLILVVHMILKHNF